MDGQGDHCAPVAIIGMACRFPGAGEPAGFHRLTLAGRRMFRPVAGWAGGGLHAALLDDWAPAPVSPEDPQDTAPVRKLAAEMSALALSDAGLREAAGRSRTGLIIASSAPGLSDSVREELGFATDMAYPPGALLSSLHAVAVAARALSAGDLDLAVAGGAELGLDPVWLALQARAGTLGTSQMRVYAADPAGLLPGDGCGVVVLARSADARAADVPVYAEIAGWTTEASGPGSASSPDGLATLQAYLRAGIDPADIALIEGQGTGIASADLAELTAFTLLRRGAGSAAALGAVSADIGYARAAAGAASLIKTILAMVAGTIPPGTGCARSHPLIESGDALLRLPGQPEPWPDGTAGTGRARLAAVNSLGTGEANGSAAMYGLTGSREVAGVHLVLRRDESNGGRAGRRRRAAGGEAQAEEAASPPDGGADLPLGPAPVPLPAAGAVAAGAVAAGAVAAGAGAAGAVTAGAAREAASDHSVFALCGGSPGELAGRLDAIAASVEGLSEAELREVARHLAFGVLAAGECGAPVRVALTAGTPCQLAERARSAARLLRAGGTGAAADPGIHASAGAAGRVAVLFGGLAGSGLTYSALLAASLAGLRTLEQLGVRPTLGVGYSLGELSGLAWAGCLPAAEAARLAAQCDQVLRGCACHPAAMARIVADAETARGLCAPDRLYIAAYEGPRTHVLAGSPSGVRELTRRAAALGIPADVLPGMHALHSPAMAGCTAPLRGVFAGTRFAPPRRRLVSTLTGRLVMPGDDLAAQMAGQLSAPVLFAQAMTLAAGEADLIAVAGPDAGLAALAAGCCGLPAVAIPGAHPAASPDLARNTPADTVAALFAAGAVTDLAPFMAAPRRADVLARQTIPRMREGEPAEMREAQPPEMREAEPAQMQEEPPGRHRDGAGQDPGPRTTARSV